MPVVGDEEQWRGVIGVGSGGVWEWKKSDIPFRIKIAAKIKYRRE